MTNALREELKALLAPEGGARRPGLKRSRREDSLYATDLPAVNPEAVAGFMARAAEAGWRARREGGWIELDREIRRPPAGWRPGPGSPEAECCLSLMARHGADSTEEAERAAARTIRRLIRAGEAGGSEWEAALRDLHGEWAARLREGKGLTPVARAFLTEEEGESHAD